MLAEQTHRAAEPLLQKTETRAHTRVSTKANSPNSSPPQEAIQ